jgi:hypothetical protein
MKKLLAAPVEQPEGAVVACSVEVVGDDGVAGILKHLRQSSGSGSSRSQQSRCMHDNVHSLLAG